jgi:hypothetical protein
MIEMSRTIPLDDGVEPRLTVDDVWWGLVEKAENPLPYIPAITAATIVERFEGGLVRDIEHHGTVREVVTFYPKERVLFVRTHGSVRGTIDNEIVTGEGGETALRFTFRLVPDGIEPGTPAAAAFIENVGAEYLDAVRTTLAAVRARVVAAQA